MNNDVVEAVPFLKAFEAACIRSNRNPAEIRCVAVSKNRDIDAIHRLYLAGHTHFGENRLQEAQRKYSTCPFRNAITLHFLGPIQTNKIAKIICLFDCIQSVDSLRYCELIEAAARRFDDTVDICLQVNLDPAKKTGFTDDRALFESAVFCSKSTELRLKGVMGIASHTNDAEQLHGEFKRLHNLYIQLQKIYGTDTIEYCSMGMSDDFLYAIQEGSTMLRIGRRIFDA